MPMEYVQAPRTGRRAPSRPFRALAAAVLLVASGTAAAQGQEWVYYAEKDDNLWNLATEYLTTMRYWGRFKEMNPMPDYRRMPPGTPVRFPEAWLRVAPAPVKLTLSREESIRSGMRSR